MDRGNDFLKAQIHAAVVQHHAFLKALEDHEAQADDARFRDLCTRYIALMRDHQRAREDYQSELGAPSAGVIKRVAATAPRRPEDLADAVRQSDYARLRSDIDMSLRSGETFRTFRDAGRGLGLRHLVEISEEGDRDHDAYRRDAHRLSQQVFIERARLRDANAAPHRHSELHR
jgi:hypothetical protein